MPPRETKEDDGRRAAGLILRVSVTRTAVVGMGHGLIR
jgi:hypothetical protein